MKSKGREGTGCCGKKDNIFIGKVNQKPFQEEIPQFRARLDRSGPPSETLELRIIRGREIWCGAEVAILKVYTPWFFAKMCRFKVSPKRPLRS